MNTRWDIEYYYKGEDRHIKGHVFAATQMQACMNFQKAFKNAFMVGYPVPTQSGGSDQHSIATDSLK